jgi:hypothetical protein
MGWVLQLQIMHACQPLRRPCPGKEVSINRISVNCCIAAILEGFSAQYCEFVGLENVQRVARLFVEHVAFDGAVP